MTRSVALVSFLLGGLSTPVWGALRIDAVQIDRTMLRPGGAEAVQLALRSSVPANIKVSFCGPDRHVVRVLTLRAAKAGAPRQVRWDGKDAAGRPVPNEAYYPVIEATAGNGDSATVDPAAFSGGEFGDITNGVISRSAGTIRYSLSQPSRVLLRAGVPGGALLKTVVDWEPRPSGSVTEFWQGRDEDNFVDVLGTRNRTLVATYMTLPAHAVIIFGNSSYSYREYLQRFGKSLPRLPQPNRTNNRKISPHFLKDRTTDRGFRVRITFPGAGKDDAAPIPTVKDRLLVNVEVDPKDREVIAGQQLELIFFANLQFHSEEERGYLPFRYPMDVSTLPPGEHILTVNVVTFGDQVGIGSRKFRIAK